MFQVLPWAEVSLKGKVVGTTPMPPLELPAGTHTFTLKNAELKKVKSVRVEVLPGQTVTVRANLFE